jgi:hypothetical protein
MSENLADAQHLDQAQLAKRWRMSPRSLERWRWRWRRIGPRYVKIGNHVRYRLQDIEAFEAANLRGSHNSV